MNKNKIFLMNHTINRKKMYKSGKRWVVSSTLALLLLGGAEAINHTNTHAATNKPVTSIASDVQKPAKQLAHQIQSNQSSSSSTSSTISKASTDQSIPASAPVHQTKPFNSAYQKYMDKMGSTDSNVAKLNTNITSNSSVNLKKSLIKDDYNQIGQTNPSDNHWIFNPNTNKYLSDNDVNWDGSGSYLGLNYKYSSELKAAEITNGTLQDNWNNGSNYAQLISNSNSNNFFPETRPSDIANAQSIKFDTSVTLVPGTLSPNVYDTRNMFSSDSNIYSLVIDSNFNTSNVTNMSDTFGGDNNLKYLALPNTFDTHNASVTNSMFSSNLLAITIRSPLTKINNNSDGLFYNMYQQLSNKDPKGNYYTSFIPNDFSKGNVGTFVANQNIPFNEYPSEISSLNNQISSEQATLNSDNASIATDNETLANDTYQLQNLKNQVSQLQNDGSITLAFSTNHSLINGQNNRYQYTINDNQIKQQPKVNNVSDTYNITNLISSDIPSGYHVSNNSNVYARIKPQNDGFQEILLQPINHIRALGATHTLLALPQAQNHIIPLTGNPVTYNGDVILNFNANGKLIKSIPVSYSINSNIGNTITLFNPNNYLNQNVQGFDTHHYLPSDTNNYQTFVIPPTANQNNTSPNNITNNYTLNFNAQPVTDKIIYNLSGSNIPNNYQGQIGSLNTISNQGTYDTNIPSNIINSGIPANYHIVSGNNNLQYNGQSHTIEIAPNEKIVSVNYLDTDNNGIITETNNNSYSKDISVPYDTKISDITKDVSIPNGYHYISGNKSYTTNSDSQQGVSLNIAGDNEKDNINITIIKTDKGNLISKTNTTQSVNGAIGTSYIIYPSNYQPIDYGIQSSPEYGMFKPNNQITNNNMTFIYDAETGGKITVDYINQNSKTIKSNTINGNIDDTGNLNFVPNGYTINPNQPSNYKITANPQTLTINVTGKPTKANVDITIVERTTTGTPLHTFTKSISESNKRVGDNYQITPSNVQPSDYDIVPNQSNLVGMVNSDGSLSNTKATFYYSVNANDIEPISITYQNQNQQYINVNNGDLTNSKQVATTIIKASDLARLGGVNDIVNITPLIHAPLGYHFNVSQSDLIDINGNKLNAIRLNQKQHNLGAMPLLLGIQTPVKPKSNSSIPNSLSSETNSLSSNVAKSFVSSSASSKSITPLVISGNSQNSSASNSSQSNSSLSNPVIDIPAKTKHHNNKLNSDMYYHKSLTSSFSTSTKGSSINHLASSIVNKKLTKEPNSHLDNDFISHNTNSLTSKPFKLGNITTNSSNRYQSNNSNNQLPKTNEINNYVDVVGVIISIMSLGIADIELKYHKFH